MVSVAAHSQQTLGIFEKNLLQLQRSPRLPNNDTILLLLPSLLKSVPSICAGMQLHSFLVKTAGDRDTLAANSLLAMYSKSSDSHSARLVFDTTPRSRRDIVTWNSIVMCSVRCRDLRGSIQALDSMFRSSGYWPKSQLVAAVVSLCGRQAGGFALGKQIHARAVSSGESEAGVFLPAALVSMYSRCGDLNSASMVLQGLELDRRHRRDEGVIPWTALISGCAVNGEHALSLGFFRKMQLSGIKPNRVTLVSILPSCAEMGALRSGQEIHAHAFRHGHSSELHLDGALMDMYCKCQVRGASAWAVFRRAETRDVVLWTSMMGSYARQGDAGEAMRILRRMRLEGVAPNWVTLLAAIAACTSQSALCCGRTVHCYGVKSGMAPAVVAVGNSLIDMYAKCGCPESSRQMFDEMPQRDGVTWGALLSGHARQGDGAEALRVLDEMQEAGFEPDKIAFLSALSACSHAGLVERGLQLFNRLSSPCSKQYACLVDLLGRAGKLREACSVVEGMAMRPNKSVWSSLVVACRVYGRLDVAEMLTSRLVEVEPQNAANYALLAGIYAEVGDWGAVEWARKLMSGRGVKKTQGHSRLEVEDCGITLIHAP